MFFQGYKGRVAIIDIDGTLADVDSIRHLVEGDNRNFDEFHRQSVNVPPNAAVLELIHRLRDEGVETVLVTGRSEKYRRLTEFWIAMHDIPVQALLMRKSFDGRPDSVVKNEIFVHIEQRFQPVLAVDDRPDLLALWLELGVPLVYDVREIQHHSIGELIEKTQKLFG